MAVETKPGICEIVRGYFDAWSRGDIAASRQYLAGDLAFVGALKRGNSAAEYLDALSGFRKLITTGNNLISELYGDNEATLIYESQTVAGPIRIAEHLRLASGKISSIMLILDPTALLAFRAEQAARQVS
jgi:hypothetical protein